MIYNLDVATDWYKKCPLTYTLGHQDPLYKVLKKHNAIEQKAKIRQRYRDISESRSVSPDKSAKSAKPAKRVLRKDDKRLKVNRDNKSNS